MAVIAILCKPQKPELGAILPGLIEWIEAHGRQAILDPIGASYLGREDSIPRHRMQEHPTDLVIVLGGDGTLLAAARAFAHTGTPILSVNLGSLGFLAEVPLEQLYPTLEAWGGRDCCIDERAMLHAQVRRQGAVLRDFDALNDVVIAKGTIARMADILVKTNGSEVVQFRADGAIVATPTGSTAYNLAANGPILAPNVDGIIITAVCPHQLNVRPLVVRGDAEISLTVAGVPEEIYLTVDGQEAVQLQLNDEVVCRRSQYSIRLLRMSGDSFYDVLREKLKWGER